MQGIDILYTGPRLDQSDLDVWQGALHLARLAPLGNRIEFTEKSFLRLIGRGGEARGTFFRGKVIAATQSTLPP